MIGESLLEHFGKRIPDKTYLRLLYFFKMKRILHLKNPKRFTEKLQWLKLYDRKDIYTTIVDKYEVKSYISQIIGKEYIIPTLGVWNNAKDIDWASLPDKFVLKTTNGGGGFGVVICKNKSKLNVAKVIERLNKSLQTDLYSALREWPYKNVPPRIIAEQYLEDESGELRDYKFYCFNGEPKVMLLASNRFTTHNFNYYDMNFNPLPIYSSEGVRSDNSFTCPELFDNMVELSRKLGEGFAHVRVDLYYANGKIYFGELTLYDASGYDNNSSDAEDLRWGSWLRLPN